MIINHSHNERNKTMKIEKMTKKEIMTILTDKGIAFDEKAKKTNLVAIAERHSKKLAMGNRTGKWYFGTRANTLAGAVAEGIAKGEIKSTLDIRKKITSKYSFTETLKRLEVEGFIKRDKKAIELTQKGREVSAQYRAKLANVA
jgi:hypothetical protein